MPSTGVLRGAEDSRVPGCSIRRRGAFPPHSKQWEGLFRAKINDMSVVWSDGYRPPTLPHPRNNGTFRRGASDRINDIFARCNALL